MSVFDAAVSRLLGNRESKIRKWVSTLFADKPQKQIIPLGRYAFFENEIRKAPVGSVATLNGHRFTKTLTRWVWVRDENT